MKIFENLLNHRLLIRLVKYDKLWIETDILCFDTQQPDTNGVKRTHIRHKTTIVWILAEKQCHPSTHFFGSFIGKRYCQDLKWVSFFLSQYIGDSMCQCLGLTTSGSSLNQQRTIDRGHRALLLGIEAL